MLVLDGVIQTAERDEPYYHEMLVHPALFGMEAPKRVLIVGGGDGGTLREVLRHPVEHATMVELDPEVIELCREHLPSLSAGAFEDSRAEVVVADGARYVAEQEAGVDAVLIDSTDPVGPSTVLFERPFYEHCARLLEGSGVLVQQCSTPFEYPEVLREGSALLSDLFAFSGAFIVAVPSYGGGYMAFAWASDGVDLAAVPDELLAARLAASEMAPRIYSPGYHKGVFQLPAELRHLLG